MPRTAIGYWISLVMLFAGPGLSVSATPDTARVLTLDAAVAEVLAVNPDVRAAQHRTTAARARIPQAKALDDPRIGVEFYNVPIDTADVTRGEDIDYRIEQHIPFPGKRFVRGEAARFDADAVAETGNGRVQDILFDLKRAYYTLYQVERSLAVNREHRALLRNLLVSARAWYASGQATADVPLKAQVELSQLDNDTILLEQERVVHQAHLKALLNRPGHEDIRLPTTLRWPRLTADLAELESMALQVRPEVKTVQAMERREQSKLTAARQTWLPDFSLGFAYKQKPGNQRDVWAGSAMINLPLFWGKNRAVIREAAANLQAAEAEYQSAVRHSQHDIAKAYVGVKTAERLVASYVAGIVPQTKTTLETAHAAYTARTVDFMTLLDAARTYRDARMGWYTAQARLGIAYAELERFVGKPLEDL